MFECFTGDDPWNLAPDAALNGGGIVSQIDDAWRPTIAKAADGVAAAGERGETWKSGWTGLGQRVEKLADAAVAQGHRGSVDDVPGAAR
jgi:hypothetical protein